MPTVSLLNKNRHRPPHPIESEHCLSGRGQFHTDADLTLPAGAVPRGKDSVCRGSERDKCKRELSLSWQPIASRDSMRLKDTDICVSLHVWRRFSLRNGPDGNGYDPFCRTFRFLLKQRLIGPNFPATTSAFSGADTKTDGAAGESGKGFTAVPGKSWSPNHHSP